jgi:hypothetical protein
MRDGKEIAAHDLKTGQKRNGSCIDFVVTETGGFPGSFPGWLPVALALEFNGKPRLRNRPFAMIVRNYMTGDDEGCCCLTG